MLDGEGQGRGFLTIGMLRYYASQYREAVYESEAALRHLTNPLQRLASHQLAGFCFAELGENKKAAEQATKARALADVAPAWMRGKLAWFEARLAVNTARLEALQQAKEALYSARPADSALVTIELIEQALVLGDRELAMKEVTGLCAVVERSPSPRIDKAIVRLFRHQSLLTEDLVAEIRRGLYRGQSLRLAALVSSDSQV